MANKALVARTLAGCMVGATGILALASPVSAQVDQVCQNASFDNFQLLHPEAPITPVVAISLDAGVVDITNAHSWDKYASRTGVDQASEVWQVEFIGADGSIVGISGLTQDLEDLVEEAHWQGSLGEVTLTAPAVGVQVRHIVGVEDDHSKNSVHVSDITVCVDVVAPTTTAPPTTLAPTTTAAPTTAPPPSGPTITEPASTTTVPASTTTTAPAPKGPTLPVTGNEATLLLLGGFWLLAAGSTMVAYGRTH